MEEELLVDRTVDGESLGSPGRPVLKRTSAEAHGDGRERTVSRKDKPWGVVTARVLFDGTHGIYVNRRTRIREQDRSPIAAELKRLMREKSRRARRTQALTADVAEAHRQVPIHPHMLGGQVKPCEAVYVHTVGTFGVASPSYYWSRGRSGVSRSTVPEAKRTRGICTCCRRFSPRGRRSRISLRTPHLLRCLCRRRGPSLLAKKPQEVTW